jgi:hypothetical protein
MGICVFSTCPKSHGTIISIKTYGKEKESMSYIMLSDVLLILDDMLITKRPSLEGTLSFKIYGGALDGLHVQVKGVEAALAKKPLAQELEETDFIHDINGKAAFHIGKGLIDVPKLSEDSRNLLLKVRETFVPSVKSPAESYEDEAAASKKKTDALAAMKGKLEAFPVAPGITLYTLLSDHVEAGLKLDTLLSSRAEVTAVNESKRAKDAGILRSKAIGLLGKFRDSLSHEVAENAALPRDLASVTFSYFDQISASREGRYPVTPATPTPPSPATK